MAAPSSSAPPPGSRRTPRRRRTRRRSRRSTSAIESPSATATLTLCRGIVRRALSEPSIGSITTRSADAPFPKPTDAALLGDRRELVALVVQRLQLGEDRVLAEPVDDQRAVAALADALVLGAGLDPAVLGEDPLLHLDGPAAGGSPLLVARARPRGQVSDGFHAASAEGTLEAADAWVSLESMAEKTERGRSRADRAAGGAWSAHERREPCWSSGWPAAAAPRRSRAAWRAWSPRGASRSSCRARPQRPNRIRARAEETIEEPLEELVVHHAPGRRGAAAARARRRRPELDPFFESLSAGRAPGDAARPDRRAAAAPPRDPRQPGRPAGADRRPDRRPQVRRGDRRARSARGPRSRRGGSESERDSTPPSASASSPSSTRCTTRCCAPRARSTTARPCSS